MAEATFSGFVFPAPKGHVQIPNGWYDEMCSQITNLAELKIVMYILRHTVGFQKPDQARALTVDELMNGRIINGKRFDRGTGLSEMSVRNGLKRAIKHGYITCETDDHNKGDIRKSYKLHLLKNEVQEVDLSDEGEVQSLDPGVQEIDLTPHNLDPKALKLVPQMSTNPRQRQRKTEEKEKNERHTPTPALSKGKPDTFIDDLFQEISFHFEEELREEDITEAKRIYQLSGVKVNEQKFRETCDEAVELTDPISEEELQGLSYASYVEYILWNLRLLLNVSERQKRAV